MVWPLIIAAGAGAAAGGAQGWFGYKAQADQRNKMLEDQATIQGLYQSALGDDPLLAMALSQSMNTNQTFNRQQLFRDASKQIDAVYRRRSGEMLQQLAGYGFERGSAQEQFMADRLTRAKIKQMGSVGSALDQAQVQMSAQNQMEAAQGAGQGILGLKQLQIAGM